MRPPLLNLGAVDNCIAVRMDKNGQPVAVGSSQDLIGNTGAGVWRFTSSGALDLSFGGTGFVAINGTATNIAHDMAIDSQNRIYASGEATGNGQDLLLFRLLPNGLLDTTFVNGLGFLQLNFSTQGSNNDIANAMRIDAKGALVLSGYTDQVASKDITVWRFQ
jgi:uncharacterized delta-60 repeat protein